MKLMCIYDGKAEVYWAPTVCRTVAEGIRGFVDAAANKNTPLGAHPEDYHIIELGIWDEFTAKIGTKAKVNLGTVLDFQKAEESTVPVQLPIMGGE